MCGYLWTEEHALNIGQNKDVYIVDHGFNIFLVEIQCVLCFVFSGKK